MTYRFGFENRLPTDEPIRDPHRRFRRTIIYGWLAFLVLAAGHGYWWRLWVCLKAAGAAFALAWGECDKIPWLCK
jgi:hypothetical protein